MKKNSFISNVLQSRKPKTSIQDVFKRTKAKKLYIKYRSICNDRVTRIADNSSNVIH